MSPHSPHISCAVRWTAAALLWAGWAAGPQRAQAAVFQSPPNPIRGGGQVVDRGKPGTQIIVVWTGKDGQQLGSTAAQVIGAAGFVNNVAPQRSPDAAGRMQLVYDYVQFAKDPAPVSYLSVEAFTPSGSDFIEFNFLDYIASVLGDGATVTVPDLYADTNKDGSLDDGDVLYSAVNLADYIPGDVHFSLGDSFSIVDGTSAELPGMIFGTSPITLDPNSPDGFSNPDPWTGEGTALSQHENTPIPEPASLLVLASALSAIAAGSVRRPGRS